MKRIVKRDIVGDATSVSAAHLVNLEDEENLTDPSEVDVGFSVKKSMLTTKASDRARYTFRMSAGTSLRLCC